MVLLPEFRPQLGIVRQAGDGLGEGVDIVLFHEQAVLDQFGDADVVGADHGLTAGHGFHEGNGDAFPVPIAGGPRRQDEDVAGIEEHREAVRISSVP